MRDSSRPVFAAEFYLGATCPLDGCNEPTAVLDAARGGRYAAPTVECLAGHRHRVDEEESEESGVPVVDYDEVVADIETVANGGVPVTHDEIGVSPSDPFGARRTIFESVSYLRGSGLVAEFDKTGAPNPTGRLVAPTEVSYRLPNLGDDYEVEDSDPRAIEFARSVIGRIEDVDGAEYLDFVNGRIEFAEVEISAAPTTALVVRILGIDAIFPAYRESVLFASTARNLYDAVAKLRAFLSALAASYRYSDGLDPAIGDALAPSKFYREGIDRDDSPSRL